MKCAENNPSSPPSRCGLVLAHAGRPACADRLSVIWPGHGPCHLLTVRHHYLIRNEASTRRSPMLCRAYSGMLQPRSRVTHILALLLAALLLARVTEVAELALSAAAATLLEHERAGLADTQAMPDRADAGQRLAALLHHPLRWHYGIGHHGCLGGDKASLCWRGDGAVKVEDRGARLLLHKSLLQLQDPRSDTAKGRSHLLLHGICAKATEEVLRMHGPQTDCLGCLDDGPHVVIGLCVSGAADAPYCKRRHHRCLLHRRNLRCEEAGNELRGVLRASGRLGSGRGAEQPRQLLTLLHGQPWRRALGHVGGAWKGRGMLHVGRHHNCLGGVRQRAARTEGGLL
mmetsp:Transcript_2517/g.6460  ORF Transcript_2517/g.6460 Transcript_2517/m.6460 type:complete len:344 (-) Transcript_2517:19-1050(-)